MLAKEALGLGPEGVWVQDGCSEPFTYIWPMTVAQRTAHLFSLTLLSLAGSRVFLPQKQPVVVMETYET